MSQQGLATNFAKERVERERQRGVARWAAAESALCRCGAVMTTPANHHVTPASPSSFLLRLYGSQHS